MNKIRNKKGLTLIELMLVIALVGSAIAIFAQVLGSIWSEQFQSISKRDFNSIVEFTRNKAVADSEVYTLEINFDKRTAGVRAINPVTDGGEPFQTDYLSQNTEKDEDDKTDNESDEENEVEWLLEGTIAPNLKEVLSISGRPLKGPLVHIYFYPNGTTDPVIFHYTNDEYPYLYFPRYFTGQIRMKTLVTGPEYYDNSSGPDNSNANSDNGAGSGANNYTTPNTPDPVTPQDDMAP